MVARFVALSLISLAGTAAFPAQLRAQMTLTIDGRVVGTTVGPVANAQVTLEEVSTGERRRVATAASGEFRILGLSPGNYTVSASASGYQPVAKTVELVVGQRAHVYITLEPNATELAPLEVVAERIPSVEIQRTSVSTPVHEREIVHLPLNTRNAMDLTAIAPGIRSYRPVAGLGLPAAGPLRGERFVNFYLDGIELKNVYDGNVIGAPQFGSPFPTDALKEFRVYLNPYDVEYARAAAYLITAVTHRGTNERKASFFGFFQDGNFVSSNDFLRALPNVGRPDFQRQQIGLNASGPILRDRLFYAASYELNNTRDFIAVVPGRPAFDPGFWDSYAGTFEAPDRNHMGITRFTYTPNEANTFDVTWSARHQSNESLFGGTVSHDAARSLKETLHTVGARHRWLVTPRLLNELSLQFVRWSENARPIVPGPHLVYPTLEIGRMQTSFNVNETHLRLVNRVTHSLDDFHGRHLVKAGVEIARVNASHFNSTRRYGSFRFAKETDSLPDRASIAVGLLHADSDVDALVEFGGWVTGVYVSDEWRPVPRLTVNLGVRYDADINLLNNDFTVPWVFDPELNTLPGLQPFLNRGNRKNDLDNISPRAAMSWDVAGNGRTYLRAGFGIIYDRAFSLMGFEERRTSVWRTYEFINPGTTDPDVLRQRIAAGEVSAKPSFSVVSLDIEAPESRQWSIGVGRQITPEFGLNVDYIHQDVRNLFALTNLNWLDRTSTAARRVLSERYGDINAWDDFTRARYRALLGQLTYQPGPDARLSLAYTLADAKADWDVINQPIPAGAAKQFYVLQRTSGDERHRFVLSGVVSMPLGLTLSTIATIASPRPFKAFLGQDVNRNDFFEDDWIKGRRYVEPAAEWRNWYRMVDLRVAKNVRLPGRGRSVLIAEVFNLLNTENYSGYFNRQTDALGNNIPSFGEPNNIFATREFQLGLRVQF